jgi:hypothetical protein
MNKHLIIAASAAAVTFAIAAPSLAHHAVNAQFDVSKEVTATGVLTKLEPINPHSRWTMDVKNPAGATESWVFESASPALLRRAGLRVRETLKVGDTYTVHYNPSRAATQKMGFMRAVTINGAKVSVTGLADVRGE